VAVHPGRTRDASSAINRTFLTGQKPRARRRPTRPRELSARPQNPLPSGDFERSAAQGDASRSRLHIEWNSEPAPHSWLSA
jgi:hypothetical protein